MTVKADFYQVVIRFARLFPDPAVFEDQAHLVQRFLIQNGLSKEKASYLHQTTDEIIPLDDQGRPAAASGTARYRYLGKTIMAEYMSNASLRLEYADLGTGLTPVDHSKSWKRQRLGDLGFELREFDHRSQSLNIPDVTELYSMLKQRADPTTLSSVELSNVPDSLFSATVAHIEKELRLAANMDGLEVEVYPARNLSLSEKQALEKRLTRESTKATVYVILSKSSKPREG